MTASKPAHRAKQRKPVKPKVARRVGADGLKEGEQICTECGKKFKLGASSHIVSALWGGEDCDVTAPTRFICSEPCWKKDRKKHAPRKLGLATTPRSVAPEKNTAPMESMFDQPDGSAG